MKLARVIPLASILMLIILVFGVYRNTLTDSSIHNYNRLTSANAAINRGSDAPDILLKADNAKAAEYEKAGRHDEAEGVYQQMLKRYPDNPDVYVNLAAIQIIKGNYEEALILCEKALTLEYENATAHNNLAVAYYTLGKYERAIDQCDLAIKYGYKVKPELLRLLAPYRVED